MYAILDIESTGGKFNEEGITEIAIYKFDGEKIVDQFISLVNPERPIQEFVVKLTGISSKMLRTAPKFYEVAKRIVEITEDCILVAHNATFDYRILRTEFNRLGYTFERKTICTVELSQKLLPEQPSHSLGKLVRSLGIPVADRHRANGDALATVELFKVLLAKDLDKLVITDFIKDLNKKLNSKFHQIVEDLPTKTGVYYFFDEEGKIIYIGKSTNLKKRINQYFTSDAPKAKAIQKDIDRVNTEITGSEMISMLLEHEEIKRQKPKYNKSVNRNLFTHALYPITDDHGYLHLKLLKADGRKKHIITFPNKDSGKRFLNHISEQYGLCEKYTGIHTEKGNCRKYDFDDCAGACVGEEDFEAYNTRVREIISKFSLRNKSQLIIGRGRTIEEKSLVLIEDGQLKGYAFYKLNHQIAKRSILDAILTPLENSKNALHIIQNQLRKNRKLKILEVPN